MPAPTVKLTLDVEKKTIIGGVKCVGNSCLPNLCVLLVQLSPDKSMVHLMPLRPWPMVASQETSWDELLHNYDLGVYPAGEYKIVAQAWDCVGNLLDEASKNVTLAGPPPRP